MKATVHNNKSCSVDLLVFTGVDINILHQMDFFTSERKFEHFLKYKEQQEATKIYINEKGYRSNICIYLLTLFTKMWEIKYGKIEWNLMKNYSNISSYSQIFQIKVAKQKQW